MQKILLALIVALVAGSVQAEPKKSAATSATRPSENSANTALFRMFEAELKAKTDDFSDGPSFDEFKGKSFDLFIPIEPYDLDNLGQPHWEYDKYTKTLEITAYNGVHVKRTMLRGRSYIGSNRFGLRVTVTDFHETVFEVATGSDSEPPESAVVEFEQQMSGEEARAFITGLKLHLVGVIKSGSACNRDGGFFPTIEDPRNIISTSCRVYVTFTHVALTRNGQVIWIAGSQ